MVAVVLKHDRAASLTGGLPASGRDTFLKDSGASPSGNLAHDALARDLSLLSALASRRAGELGITLPAANNNRLATAPAQGLDLIRNLAAERASTLGIKLSPSNPNRFITN